MERATHELSNQFNRASEANTMKTIQTYIDSKQQEFMGHPFLKC